MNDAESDQTHGPRQPGAWITAPPRAQFTPKERLAALAVPEEVQARARWLAGMIPQLEQAAREGKELLRSFEAQQVVFEAKNIIDGPAWSDEARERAIAEVQAIYPDYPSDRDLKADIETFDDCASGRTSTPEIDQPRYLLMALRLSVAVAVGVVVAGPLSALIPPLWNPWITEPMKGAIGGAAGAITAEATRSAEGWAKRREVEMRHDWLRQASGRVGGGTGENLGRAPVDGPNKPPDSGFGRIGGI